MLPTCREAAQQLSDNIDRPATGLSWLKLKLHLLMCVYCRRYATQIELSAGTVRLLNRVIKPGTESIKKAVSNYQRCKASNNCTEREQKSSK